MSNNVAIRQDAFCVPTHLFAPGRLRELEKIVDWSAKQRLSGYPNILKTPNMWVAYWFLNHAEKYVDENGVEVFAFDLEGARSTFTFRDLTCTLYFVGSFLAESQKVRFQLKDITNHEKRWTWRTLDLPVDEKNYHEIKTEFQYII